MIEYISNKRAVFEKHPLTVKRNYRDVLQVTTDLNRIMCDFEKTFITDFDLKQHFDSEFEFFTKPLPDAYSPYTLNEGTIFRPVQSVRNKETYNYFIIKNELVGSIPNYKTLEVILAERGKTLEEIKVIEQSEFIDLLLFNNGASDSALPIGSLPFDVPPGSKLEEQVKKGGGGGGGGGSPTPSEPELIESKENEWSPDMELTSISEQYSELIQTASTAEELIESTTAQNQNIVDMAIADANAAKAEAEQARAEAEQATAEANAAKAEAEAAKAEADAEKSKYEQNNT